MKRVIILILAAIIALPAFAQKGKMHEQIQATKIAYFTTELELTPDEAKTFWPIYNEYWKETQNRHRNTMIALGGLRKLTAAEGATDAQYKEQLNKYVVSLREESAVVEKYLPEFYKIFTPERVAKLLLTEENFRHKLTKMWKDQQKAAISEANK